MRVIMLPKPAQLGVTEVCTIMTVLPVGWLWVG